MIFYRIIMPDKVPLEIVVHTQIRAFEIFALRGVLSHDPAFFFSYQVGIGPECYISADRVA